MNNEEPTSIEEPVVPVQPETSAADTSSAAPVSELPAAPAKRKSKLGLWIGLGVLVAILLGAGGTFLGVRGAEGKALESARLAEQSQDWTGMKAACEKGMALKPEFLLQQQTEFLTLRGKANFHLGEVEQALQDLDEAAKVSAPTVEIYLIRTDIYTQQGDTEKAIAEAEKAGELDDTLSLPYTLKAWQAYRQNKVADALTAAEAAISRNTDQPQAYIIRGAENYFKEEFDAAKNDLDKALELAPENSDALALRMALANDLHDTETFNALYQKVEALTEKDASALWAEAQYQSSIYDNLKTNELMKQAVEKENTRPELHTWLAFSYWLEEQHEQILSSLTKALELNPEFVPALTSQLGDQVEYNTINAEDYQAAVDKIKALAPNSIQLRLVTASWAMEHNQNDKALEAANEIIALQPSLSDGYAMRGIVYDQMDEVEKANEDYTKAIELNPQIIAARVYKALNLNDDNQLAKANELLGEAEKINPNSITYLFGRANIELANEHPEEARKWVEKAEKIDPMDHYILDLSAWISMALNDNLSAFSAMEKAESVAPQVEDVYVTRAHIYMSEEKYDLAEKELNTAKKLQPDNIYVYTSLSQLNLANDNPGQAVYFANKAKDIDPKNIQACTLLANGYAQSDNTSKAEDTFVECIKLDPEEYSSYMGLAHIATQDGEIEKALEYLKQAEEYSSKMSNDEVAELEDFTAFLEEIPPLVNGVRTYEDTLLGYRFSTSPKWILDDYDTNEERTLLIFYNLDFMKDGDANMLVVNVLAPDQSLLGYSASVFADYFRDYYWLDMPSTTYKGRHTCYNEFTPCSWDTFEIMGDSNSILNGTIVQMEVFYLMRGDQIVIIEFYHPIRSKNNDAMVQDVAELAGSMNILRR